MLAFRIFGILLIGLLGTAILTFLITKDPRWLRFARQSLRFGVIILLILMSFYALERFLLVL